MELNINRKYLIFYINIYIKNIPKYRNKFLIIVIFEFF